MYGGEDSVSGDGGGKLESLRVNYFSRNNVNTNESTQHAKLLFSDA